MDFIDLIPAARSLLRWSQGKLAERTGLSQKAIANIENRKTEARQSSLACIRNVMEQEGIEFLRNGVILRQDGIRVISGEDSYLHLLDDVIETFSAPGLDKSSKELLIWCADDRKSPPAVNDKYRILRRMGVRMRQLVEQDNTYLMGPVEEYRYVPSVNFVNVVKLNYSDKFATVNGNGTRAMIHRDKETARSHRAVFDLLWDNLGQPQESEADERF